MTSRWSLGLMALCIGCGQTSVVIDAGSGGRGSGSVDSGMSPPPSVLLLLDTSGSMVWKAGCTCTSPGCDECMPDCTAGERSRWHDILAAIGGSYVNYSCEAVARADQDKYTFDLGYPKPDVRLGAGVSQLSDGLLDRYAASVVFGLATFDGMRTLASAGDLVPFDSFRFDLSAGPEGQFSYGRATQRPDGTTAGKLSFPTAENYFIDTGIVNESATEGALVWPFDSDATAHIKDQARAVRPFGGTPTASALDDLYFVYKDRNDAKRTNKNYILFITDGSPDDDFRDYPDPGCDCAERGNCPADVDPAAMSCPYPTAPEAARRLHCGYNSTSCTGSIAKLEVVTYSIDDTSVRQANETIASQANGATTHATNPAQLKVALDAAMRHILDDASKP